jgi:hypothetical protein
MRLKLVAGATPVAFLALTSAAFGLPPFTTATKSSPTSGGQSEVFAIAAGCHATFDRLTIRLRSGGTAGYRAGYVRRVVQDGSGRPVSLLGNRRILATIQNARAHTPSGGVLLRSNVLTPRCPQLRQVKLAGDFEGTVSLGLGLTRRTGFRVFRLTAPKRIVIDVAH